MQKLVSLACAAVVFCGSFAVVAETNDDPAGRPLEFTAIDGRTIDRDTLRGKVVVVEFWATWCGPCVGEIPHMKKLYARHQRDDVVFLGIAEDDDVNEVRRYVKKHEIAWATGLDSERLLAQRFGVETLPAALILGPDGRVAWQGAPGDLDQPLHDAIRGKE